MISQIIIIAILARNWSSNYFSTWILLNSVYQVAPIMDLGLGYALKQELIRSSNSMKGTETSSLISATFSILLCLTLIFLIGYGFFILFQYLLNHHLPTLDSIGFLGFLLLIIPFSLSNHFYLAYESSEVFLKSLLDIFLSILFILVSIFASKFQYFGITIFFSLSSMIQIIPFLFFIKLKDHKLKILKPKKSFLIIRPFLQKSLSFWFLSVSSSILINLIAWTAGNSISSQERSQYMVLQRLFMAFFAFQVAIIIPIQTQYTRYFIVKDFINLFNLKKKVFYSSILLSLVFSMTIFILSKFLVHMWINQNLILSNLSVLMLVVWCILWSFINSESVFLNGIELLKPQIVILTSLIVIFLTILKLESLVKNLSILNLQYAMVGTLIFGSFLFNYVTAKRSYNATL
jgi:hypothetical protein